LLPHSFQAVCGATEVVPFQNPTFTTDCYVPLPAPAALLPDLLLFVWFWLAFFTGLWVHFAAGGSHFVAERSNFHGEFTFCLPEWMGGSEDRGKIRGSMDGTGLRRVREGLRREQNNRKYPVDRHRSSYFVTVKWAQLPILLIK
jgi:hypothetical protein